jgi:dTDP-glucose 4,6-dehydratase
MESILVTGGCGFIGSHFVRLLCAEENFRVVNLDRLTYAGNLENLSDIVSGFRFVRGDIADRELVDRLLEEERPWAIVNFAAESHVDRSILDASPFLRTNIGGVHVLLEAIRAVPVKRFLHVSTDEVYGDREGRDAAAEESALCPGNPYAASKASADLLCMAYRRTYDLPIIITRSSNNYGPFQFPEKLIPLCIRNAVAGFQLPVYGDGGQSRDWLHVEDNCRAILAVLKSAEPGSIYNVGAGGEWKNLDVVRTICRAVAGQTGQHLEKVKSNIEFVADRPGHDRRYALKTEKIRRELGWFPRTEFGPGLDETVRWYLSHPEWVARVTSGEYQEYHDSVYLRTWGKSS